MTDNPGYFSKLFSDPQAECRALETYVYAHIPLTQAMQMRATSLDAHGLTLSAPLTANHNHQRSAFGGSLASLAMLAGWGLLWLALDHGHGTIIVVRDTHMEFLRPVTGTLLASCAFPTATAWGRFTTTLTRRRKARLELRIEIVSENDVCARCTGMFVAYHEATGG